MKSSRLLWIGTLAAAAWLLQTMPVHAAETELLRAADYISYDSQGNAVCTENGTVKTGKFSLEPNFTLGDVGQDGVVNSNDASEILQASALAGAGSGTVEEIISANHDNYSDEESALFFADINQDSKIDALDAAGILTYTAGLGSGDESNPLGLSYYYADENGILQKGLIQDTANGTMYYADDDYTLVTGWQNVGDRQYYFDSDGTGHTGWLTDGDDVYYLTNSVPEVGFTYLDGKMYCFDADGRQVTGFQQADSGNYYYFNPDDKGAAA